VENKNNSPHKIRFFTKMSDMTLKHQKDNTACQRNLETRSTNV